MCGICGIFSKKGVGLKEKTKIEERTMSLVHRGPDNQAVMSFEYGFHGHARLSILDMSKRSNQPMEQDGYILCFNGEIWNYKELKIHLEKKGHIFKTTSDTEVLLHHLIEYGVDSHSLNMVDGMFSFAFSFPDGRTFLVRDRFGVIPLYYVQGSGLFSTTEWCSERKHLPTSSLVKALPPGYLFYINENRIESWYDGIVYDKEIQNVNLLCLLRKSIQERMVSDAPLCCLISGGIDSSVILYYAKKMKKDIVAYTAKTNDSSDLHWARRICRELEVPLQEVTISLDLDIYRKSLQTIEISSKAQIEIGALCLPLAQAIRSDGFKVCLSGEGADELLGGYGSMIIKGHKANDEEYFQIKKYFLYKMSRGNFVRCNKIFMAHSIECRLPFLSYPLVEALVNCPKKQNIPNKKLLKESVQGLLPDKLIKRPKETFQGGCRSDKFIREKLGFSPIIYYNRLARNIFGTIPKE